MDRQVIQQILGSLMLHPQFLSQVDKYNFTLSDFSNRFEKYIFAAIDGLYRQGAQKISEIDISNYLRTDGPAFNTFTQLNGMEYLQDILELANPENFNYYYSKLKKINLIKDLKKDGYDISKYYCEDPLNPKANEINKRFEELTISEIFDNYKRGLLHLENEYSQSEEVKTQLLFENMTDLTKKLKEEVSIGKPIQGEIYNDVINGATKGTLTIRSGSSGLGKALPNSELIPTPDGWKTVQDIEVGDYLFDGFGNPTKVLGKYPQGKKTVWKISFEDGRSLKCCDEHLWSYFLNTQSLNEICDRKFETKTLKEINKKSLKDKNGKYKFLIPQQLAVHYSNTNNSKLPKIFYKKIGSFLKYGLFKNIPKRFLQDTILNRIELLSGLIDYEELLNCNHTFFDSNFLSLADDVKELCHSLGIKTRYIDNINKDALRYRLLIYIENGEKSFMNSIVKIECLDYKEEMTCFYVDNTEHLFLAGDFIVTHNTRQSLGDACFLAFPCRFNSTLNKWEVKGSNEKVLFVITEQRISEIQKMVLAYLTDINEDRFKYANLSEEEEDRVNKALLILEKYKENFILVKCPNPSIELVKTLVRENCLMYNIDHVFFDYIFINPALLKEFKGFALRNDELLLMFAAALKDLAVELNVTMMTSTQVSRNAENNKDIRNETSLAGGIATINKADNGAIMSRPTKEEIDTLQDVINDIGGLVPNLVTDIFKVRSGRWTQVRIWSIVNLGTLKKEDLFITDSRLMPIEGFFKESRIRVDDWEDSEEIDILNFVKELNE